MTNPSTCLHKVIGVSIAPGLIPFVYCVSCDTNITADELYKDRFYEYDITHNVWVHVPNREK